MRQKLSQIAFVVALTVVFAGCYSNSKGQIKYDGEKSKLSAEVFERLDYQVKESAENLPGDWHREQFQTLWQRTFFVKRKTSLKEQANTFPRYWVREEVYENEDLAAKRLARIQEKPPDLSGPEQEYWIVTGFQVQKNVYFIQTDGVLFSYYIKDFAGKLSEAIK
jgi:hypothetical protein